MTAKLQHKYSTNQLRDLFRYCQSDFERFLSLLVWLEKLELKQEKKK